MSKLLKSRFINALALANIEDISVTACVLKLSNCSMLFNDSKLLNKAFAVIAFISVSNTAFVIVFFFVTSLKPIYFKSPSCPTLIVECPSAIFVKCIVLLASDRYQYIQSTGVGGVVYEKA